MRADAPDEESLVGDACHIVAQSEDGPRGRSSMETDERDGYSNLILLCKIHHKVIDDQWRTYTVTKLLELKELHEQWVRESLPEFSLGGAPAIVGFRESGVPAERAIYRGANELAPIRPASKPGWEAYERGDYGAAIPEIEAWTRQHPDDAAAWEALAWAEYNCFRYTEALRSIRSALITGQASAEAPYIRACILAEDGIERGDRASIMEANALFQRAARKRGIWVDHYNYGNTLTALGRHAEAKERYLDALAQEPDHPQVLKNLASTFHLLDEHGKEMECFDRVLSIDPDHPQGLASKAVSLLVDTGDAASAVALLQRALEVAPDMSIRWPAIWYWLAKAHRAGGDAPAALQTATRGLELVPSDASLRDLKAHLLAELWRHDPTYCEEASVFFEFMVQLAPYAYEYRSELIDLYTKAGHLTDAWQLLDDAFAIFGFGSTTRLQESPLAIQEIRKSVHFLADYAEFRGRHSVDDYWNVEDPLYIDGEYSGSPPPLSVDGARALTQFSAVAFGLGCDVLHEAGTEGRDASCMSKMLEQIYRPLAIASVSLITDLLVSLVSDNNKESATLPLSELPDFVGFVLFRELCRQAGYIHGLFHANDVEALISLQSSGEMFAALQHLAALSLDSIYDALKHNATPTAEGEE